MEYTFNKSARIRADANAAGELFSRLEREDRLTAHNVVDESRPEDAPLHPVFEWRDAVAAEKWREQQAMHLISNIRVIREDTPEPQRLFFNVRVDEPEYRSLPTIIRRGEKEQLIERALKDYEALERRYREIVELADVFSAVRQVRQRVTAEEEMRAWTTA